MVRCLMSRGRGRRQTRGRRGRASGPSGSSSPGPGRGRSWAGSSLSAPPCNQDTYTGGYNISYIICRYLIKDLGVSSSSSSCSGLVVAAAGAVTGLVSLPLVSVSSDSSPLGALEFSELSKLVEGLSSILTPLD